MEMMTAALITGLVAAAIGIGIVWSMMRKKREAKARTLRAKAEQILRQARSRAHRSITDAELETRQEGLQARHETAEEVERVKATLVDEQMRLAAIEERNLLESKELDDQFKLLKEKRKVADALKQTNRNKRREAESLARKEFAILQQKAGATADEVKARLAEAFVARTRAHWSDRLRNLDTELTPELERVAKRIVGISIGRYRKLPDMPRLSSYVPLGPNDLAWFHGEGAAILTQLEEETGVKQILQDEEENIKLDSPNGPAKELCRRTLAKLLALDKTKRQSFQLPVFVSAAKKKLFGEIHNLGLTAFRRLDVKPPKDEIVDLVGRLAYRTSYAQNQYHHSLEAGMLAGLMAEELNMDPRIARRAGLLHDIGKALTHEIEGSHALIGAEIARKAGESEEVVNAIGSHHNDMPATSPYSPIVTAADAASGARPGARRELMEAYVDRIGDLERAAASFKGVSNVYAIQAGRELRILVNEKQVSDDRAKRLASEIASKISDELTFPGQIKVTVIRETSAEAVAR